MVKVIRKDGEGKKQLNFLIKNLEGKVAKVGFFESSKYPAVAAHSAEKAQEGKKAVRASKGHGAIPVAYVATIQEYGDPSHNIPKRSFMRITVLQNRDKWRAIARKGVKRILKGKDTIAGVMEDVGLQVEGDIREKITSIILPPLKEATKRARIRKYAQQKKEGSLDKPLVETGYMLNSLTHVVEDK